MRILTVAFPFAPVRSDTAGGAEQIAGALDRALTEAGHHSCLLACTGSQARGKLFTIEAPGAAIDARVRTAAHESMRAAIRTIVADEKIEIVHLHGLDFMEYAPADTATVVTLHLPIQWYGPRLQRLSGNIHPVCVSAVQDRDAGRLRRETPIANGIPSMFRHGIRRREYCVMLSRICPEKNIHQGIDATRRADVPLLIAGDVFPYAAHRSYFETDVVPRLDSRRRFVGRAGRRAKVRLLNGAKALLIPSSAPETSSLVAMEAMSAGTPVIAFKTGALPEIIEHGRTGFLVDDEEDMAEAIDRCIEIDARTCQASAEARFSEGRMIADYFALYRRLGASP